MKDSLTAFGPIWMLGVKWEVEADFDFDPDGSDYDLTAVHLIGVYHGDDSEPYSLPVNVPIDAKEIPGESFFFIDNMIRKRLAFFQKSDEE